MSMSALSKQKATSLTRGAQAALALLIVGAGTALAVRSGGDLERPGPLVLPVVDVGVKTQDTQERHNLDPASVGDRLAAVSNHPKPVVVTPTAATPGAVPPPAPVADLRYLGAVGMGSNKVALVSEGGKQKFISTGDEFAGGTVQSISDTEVRIGGNATKTLTLAGRTPEVVTRTGRPGMTITRPGGTQANPATASGLQVYERPPTPDTATKGAWELSQEQVEMREKLGTPEYVIPGDEEIFHSLREELRQHGKFASDDELNEEASRIWMEKRGDSPEMDRVRMMQKSAGEKSQKSEKGEQ